MAPKESSPSPAPEPAKAAQQRVVYAHKNYDGTALSPKAQVLLISGYSDTVAKLRTAFEADPNLAVHEEPAQNIAAAARQLIPCLVMGSITQAQDIVKALGALKALKNELKHGKIKFIIISRLNNPTLFKTFEAMGCQEYIIEPISDRSLKFKVDLQTKSIAGQRKKIRQDEIERQEDAKNADTKKKDKKAKAAAGPTKEGEVGEDGKKTQMTDGKETADDVWVFKGSQPVKKGKKWTMRMKGPDPAKGDWVETGKDADGNPQWRFMEKGVDPATAKKKKGWEFTGEKPTFQNGDWAFEGEKPSLNLIDENGEKQASKVDVDASGGLVMAKDSETALKKVREQDAEAVLTKEAKKKALFDNKPAKEEKKDANTTKDKKEGEAAAFKNGMDFRDFAMEDDEKKDPNDKRDAKVGEGGPKWENKVGQEEDAAAKKEEKPGDSKKTAKEKRGLNAFSSDKQKEQKEEQNSADARPGGPQKAKLTKSESEEEKSEDDTDSIFGSSIKGPKRAKGKVGFEKSEGERAEDEKGAEAEAIDAKKQKEPRENPFAPKKPDAKAAEEKAAAKEEKRKNPFGKKEDERKPGDLAELAMNLEDEKEGLNGPGKDEKKAAELHDKRGPDEKPKAWNQNDTATDGKKKKEPRENPFAPKKDGAGKSEKEKSEKEEAEKQERGMGAGDRNFLKKKEKKPGFSDQTDSEAEAEGGWSMHNMLEEKKKRAMSAHDSEDAKKDEGEDKLIEIESPSGTLNVKKGVESQTFEFPLDHFGNPNGVWENAGRDPKDPNRKIYVFVVPDVKLRRAPDIRQILTWWVFRGERPTQNTQKKVWVCKENKPEKFDGFITLPKLVQTYLLEICPVAGAKKKEEEALAAKKKDRRKEEKIQEQSLADELRALDPGAVKEDEIKKVEEAEEGSPASLADIAAGLDEVPAAEAEAKPSGPPASAPMMAVFISEILVSSRGDVTEAVKYFCDSLAKSYNGASVAVIRLKTGQAIVVGSNASQHKAGKEYSGVDKPAVREAIESAKPVTDPSGMSIYCPIRISASQPQVVGLVCIESNGVSFKEKVVYLNAITQCLRGVVKEAA